jgi:hypothetical protein
LSESVNAGIFHDAKGIVGAVSDVNAILSVQGTSMRGLSVAGSTWNWGVRVDPNSGLPQASLRTEALSRSILAGVVINVCAGVPVPTKNDFHRPRDWGRGLVTAEGDHWGKVSTRSGDTVASEPDIILKLLFWAVRKRIFPEQ